MILFGAFHENPEIKIFKNLSCLFVGFYLKLNHKIGNKAAAWSSDLKLTSDFFLFGHDKLSAFEGKGNLAVWFLLNSIWMVY